MTPAEALQVLDNLGASSRLTRQEHDLVREAVRVLQLALPLPPTTD